MSWFWLAGFVAIIGGLVLMIIPVRTAASYVVDMRWQTVMELVEEETDSDYVCITDSVTGEEHCPWESSTETVVLERRTRGGTWQDELAYPDQFETSWGQRNRSWAVFTIHYQYEDGISSGQVSQQAFGRYFIGMPCEIYINIYGLVIFDNCSLARGR
jgi:hypothetical protein